MEEGSGEWGVGKKIRLCLRHDLLAIYHAEAQRRKGAEIRRKKISYNVLKINHNAETIK